MRSNTSGFTLIELLVGAAIGLITVAVAGQVLVDQLKSTERIEDLQRQREDWMRTTSFIESEINLAEKIEIPYSGSSTVACGKTISNLEVKMIINFASMRNLVPAIYYVSSSESGWRDNLLRRCGPEVDQEGIYTNTAIDSIMIDGMTSTTDGFVAVVPNEKYAQITLKLEGLLNNAYGQTTGSRARIQETIIRPKEYSLCQQNVFSNVVELGTNANTSDQSIETDDVLVCGNGGGDTITGGNGNDVIEAGDPGSSELNGNRGNDRLYGSDSADTLFGGDGDDLLIGRGGNDELNGGIGTNNYLPGLDRNNGPCDRDTVNGGPGYDIIHLQGNSSEYTYKPCSPSRCRVQRNDSGDRKYVDIFNGEKIVFLNEAVPISDTDLPSMNDPVDNCAVDTTYQSPPPPTPPTLNYTLSASTTTINETDNNEVKTTVSVTGFSANHDVFWRVSGSNVNSADFDSAGTRDGLDGDETFRSTKLGFVITHRAEGDNLTEGNESFTITLYSDAARTNQIGDAVTITIQDTSILPSHFGSQITSRLFCASTYSGNPALKAQCENCTNRGFGLDNDWYTGSLTCGP